ncbi:MAG: helix-turn-helix domain-containing protein [Rhodospirillales bacterium]|nr:helix-turn-helix domain-containing protein [Rhodospirillales bacterium]
MNSPFLNQIELAGRWRLSHRTLERWRWQGRGPRYLKIGGRVVYRAEDIDAYESGRLCLNAGGELVPAAEAAR